MVQGLRSGRGGAWRPGSAQGLRAPLRPCPTLHPAVLTEDLGLRRKLQVSPQPPVLLSSERNGEAETKTRTDQETQRRAEREAGGVQRAGGRAATSITERWAPVPGKKSFLGEGQTQINTLLCQTQPDRQGTAGRCHGNQPFPSNCSGTLLFKQEMVVRASWKNY